MSLELTFLFRARADFPNQIVLTQGWFVVAVTRCDNWLRGAEAPTLTNPSVPYLR